MPLNIDLLQILLHIFNFLILAGGLTFLLFKPINKFLNEREKMLAKQVSDNEKTAAENERIKAEYNQKFSDAETQIAALKMDAEKEIADITKNTLIEAKEKAAAIVLNAEKEAEARKVQILDSAQTEIGELVVSATQKLLSDTVTPERNLALYDEFIRLAEETVADKRAAK